MRRAALALLLVAACQRSSPRAPPAPARAAPTAAELDVTYLANEGVLLESGGVRVVIDGLLRPNDLPYAVLPAEQREALESATPPFDGIDLVLVSHMHRDHFHAEAVGRYLASATGARLVSSEEVVGLVARDFADWKAIEPRARGVAWAVGRRETVDAGGARVTFIGLSHGDGRVATVQNFGQLVEIGRWKVFHAGDGVASDANYAGSGLAAQGIDLAFLPWWYVADDAGLEIVRRHIAPRRIALIHAAPADEGPALEAIRARAPDAVLFRRMLEDRLRL